MKKGRRRGGDGDRTKEAFFHAARAPEKFAGAPEARSHAPAGNGGNGGGGGDGDDDDGGGGGPELPCTWPPSGDISVRAAIAKATPSPELIRLAADAALSRHSGVLVIISRALARGPCYLRITRAIKGRGLAALPLPTFIALLPWPIQGRTSSPKISRYSPSSRSAPR
jgi:hypothetical protein